jgi:hypothetical protein
MGLITKEAKSIMPWIDKMKCSFCGERFGTGYWQGPKDIACCRYCATTVLPRFIADSCYPIRRADINRLLNEIRAEFLYSAALNATPE